jgi:hypothetical protein
VDRYGLPDDRLNSCLDCEYWLRLATPGARFAYGEEKLAGSRLYAENKTWSARVKVHEEINDMLKGALGQVPDRWLSNYAHSVVGTRSGLPPSSTWVVTEIGVRSILAALRWNGRVSRRMCRQVAGWIWASARESLKRALPDAMAR